MRAWNVASRPAALVMVILAAMAPLASAAERGRLSGFSDETDVLNQGNAPLIPQGLTVTVAGPNAILDWRDVTGHSISGYKLYKSFNYEPFYFLASTAVSSFSDPLDADGVYRYRVTAIDGRGEESAPSHQASLLFDYLPPENLQAQSGLDGHVPLTWAPPGTGIRPDSLQILLVSDQTDGVVRPEYDESVYTTAFTEYGVSYTVWDHETQGSPSLADLQAFNVIFWITGVSGGCAASDPTAGHVTLTLSEEATLVQWLQLGGKNLVLSGMWIGWNCIADAAGNAQIPSELFDDYMRISYPEENFNGWIVPGAAWTLSGAGGPIGGSADWTARWISGESYPDMLEPAGDSASAVFAWNDGSAERHEAGIMADGGSFKTVMLACPVEQIGGPDEKNLLVANLLNWFSGLSSVVEWHMPHGDSGLEPTGGAQMSAASGGDPVPVNRAQRYLGTSKPLVTYARVAPGFYPTGHWVGVQPFELMFYYLYRSLTTPVAIDESHKIGQVGPDATSYDDWGPGHNGLTNGTTYHYVAVADYDGGPSGGSNEAEASPAGAPPDYVPFLPDTTAFGGGFIGQAFHFLSPGQCLEVSAGNLDDEISFQQSYVPSVLEHVFSRMLDAWATIGQPGVVSNPLVAGVAAGWSYPDSLNVTFALVDSTSQGFVVSPYSVRFPDALPEFLDVDPMDTTSVQQVNLFVQFLSNAQNLVQTPGSLGSCAETTTDPTSRPYGSSIIDIFDVSEKRFGGMTDPARSGVMTVPALHLIYRISNTGTGGDVAYDVTNTSLIGLPDVPAALEEAASTVQRQWDQLAQAVTNNYNLILSVPPAKTPCSDRGGLRLFIHEDGASCAEGLQNCVIYGDGSTLGLPLGPGGPPTADAGPDRTVECTSTSGTSVKLNGTGSSDPSGAVLTFAWSAPGIVFDDSSSATPTGHFPVGTTTVTLVVSNGSDRASDTAEITVEDSTPASITVTVDRGMLWPPNHRLVTITATVEVSDVCDGSPVWFLSSITSNEPDDGLGDGDQPDDIQDAALGTPDTVFRLRSERDGSGTGRIYTIVYTVQDAAGNTATASAEVTVGVDMEGVARSFLGYNEGGTDFDPGVAGYSIVVPADVSFDPRRIDVSTVEAGNTLGIVGAIETRLVDVTGDGLIDLEARYLVEPTRQLQAQMDGLAPMPIGLHWRNVDGSTYWVPDIFQLGPPLTTATTGVQDPSSAALYRVRPNPSAEFSRLDYAVSSSAGALVEAGVFNIAGQRVRHLMNAFQAAGRHELSWDGRNDHGVMVPGGVYFYHVRIGSETVIRQLILAR